MIQSARVSSYRAVILGRSISIGRRSLTT